MHVASAIDERNSAWAVLWMKAGELRDAVESQRQDGRLRSLLPTVPKPARVEGHGREDEGDGPNAIRVVIGKAGSFHAVRVVYELSGTIWLLQGLRATAFASIANDRVIRSVHDMLADPRFP